jgi:hypothetical protein
MHAAQPKIGVIDEHTTGRAYDADGDRAEASREKAALERCNHMIKWYEASRVRAGRAYRLFETAIILFSALTPVLILSGAVPPLVQAVPPAIAGLCATLIATYRWREDWIRYTVAAETLRSELVKYSTRTTADYSVHLTQAAALDAFVYKMESVAASEIAEWRSQHAQKTEPPAADPPGTSRPTQVDSRKSASAAA